MKELHLILDENSSAMQWANSQADKIGARGHVGTHLDCYTSVPAQSEYDIQAIVLDCMGKMPDADGIAKLPSLENMGLVLHTGNVEKNIYGTETYFGMRHFLSEGTLQTILEKKPLFLLIDSHGIAEAGQRHISFDKTCEAHGCHVIENVDLSSIGEQTTVSLRIVVDIDNPSTGKPCKVYMD